MLSTTSVMNFRYILVVYYHVTESYELNQSVKFLLAQSLLRAFCHNQGASSDLCITTALILLFLQCNGLTSTKCLLGL